MPEEPPKNDGVDPGKKTDTNYDTWGWKEIKVAINGGVSMSTNQEMSERKGVSDPQSFVTASYAFGNVQNNLQHAKDAFDKNVRDLAAEWKGPAATSFGDFMKKFQGTLDGHLNTIKGPPSYSTTLWDQGNALINAQNKIAEVDDRVANEVIQEYTKQYNEAAENYNTLLDNPTGEYSIPPPPTGILAQDPPWHYEDGTLIVHVSQYPWAVQKLDEGMRPVIKELAGSYKTAGTDMPQPADVTYPGAGNQPPPVKEPPPPPKPPAPPEQPPPPKQPPPPEQPKLDPPGGPGGPGGPGLDNLEAPGGGELPPGADGIGPNGELLGPDGKPLLGPNGELLGPDGKPLLGPNGELLGPDGKPLNDPSTKLAGGGGLTAPGTADIGGLPPLGGALDGANTPSLAKSGPVPAFGAPGGASLPPFKSLTSGSAPPKRPGLSGLGGGGSLSKLGGGAGLGRFGGGGGIGKAGLSDLDGPAGKLSGRGGGVPGVPGAGAGRGAGLGAGLGAGAGGAAGGRAGAAPGMGGMPMGGAPMGGAGQNKEEERERTTWLMEDEDTWGARSTAGSGVLGRADYDD
jgi:uncharacterized protein YukE